LVTSLLLKHTAMMLTVLKRHSWMENKSCN
jgi:hypothetical protein